MEPTLLILLLGSVLLLGYLARTLFKKIGFPDVLWLLLAGVILGPVTHILDPTSLIQVSELVSSLAIIILLFDGGMSLRLKNLAEYANEGLIFSMIRFVLCALISFLVMLLVGYEPAQSILMGVVLGGMSFAVAIPLAAKLENLSEQGTTILSIASISDNIAVVLAFAIMDAILIGSTDLIQVVQIITQEFSTGLVLGAIAGITFIPVFHRFKLENISYIAVLSFILLLYPLIEIIGASGAMAIFVFGIILGNSERIQSALRRKEPYRISLWSIKQPQRIISFFMYTFFFVFLGALLTIKNTYSMIIGLILSASLVLSQQISLQIMKKVWSMELKNYDHCVIQYMVPVGLSAAILTNFIYANNIPGTEGFMDITFTVILTTVIITTLGVYLACKKEENDSEKNEQRD